MNTFFNGWSPDLRKQVATQVERDVWMSTNRKDTNMGKCYNKIEIKAPIGKVWDTIRDFHDVSWAPNVITSVSKQGDKSGTEVGAKRVLNDVFHETLVALDPGKFTFSYSIDDGPGPVASGAVSNYLGVVKLSKAKDGTLVEWSSTFQSANENEVADFCNPIYMALLNALHETLS
jgi:carbon monoxide dehydrogenase subunit G